MYLPQNARDKEVSEKKSIMMIIMIMMVMMMMTKGCTFARHAHDKEVPETKIVN